MRDPGILPETVIYDVDLTLDASAGAIGGLGLNAMAHAVEASTRGTGTRSFR